MCYNYGNNTIIVLKKVDKYWNHGNMNILYNMEQPLKIAVIVACVFYGIVFGAENAFPIEHEYLRVRIKAMDEFNKAKSGAKGVTGETRSETASGLQFAERKEPGQGKFSIKDTFDEIRSGERETEKIQILQKSGIDRIGVQAAYDDFTGIRFGKYFSVGQRVEIFQEARPIDAYILDAKAIRYLGADGAVLKWDTPAHFRSQIMPMFTRAYGTEFTMDNPDDPGTQIRFTLDYRDIYKQYYPKYTNLGVASWLQDEIMLINSGKLDGIGWNYNLNAGYRYSTVNETDVGNSPTKAGYENRHTYLLNVSLAPTDRFEWFGQFEYFKSKRPRSTFAYSPDHWYFRTELRTKTPDFKTSVIPSFSYSTDFYFPFKNRFEKYEMGLRVGHAFTDKLSATTQLQYVLSLRDEPDNTAPDYGSPHPIKDSAAWAGVENRLSYNVWNDFYLQSGLDIAVGTNMSDFDNVGTFLGVEYYKPGVLRANAGWNTTTYYNIDDMLNTVGVNVYILM